jgi:hypothetical protein
MSWARVIEYLLVILVAAIVALVIIMYAFPKSACTNCAPNIERLRVACDNQFNTYSGYSTVGPPYQLDAMREQEDLIAYVQPSTDSNATDGFSSAATPSSVPTDTGYGYVLVRVEPDLASGQSGRGPDVTRQDQGHEWKEVTVTVARYVDHTYNNKVCSKSVELRGNKYEFYCDTLSPRFSGVDYGQISYRVYVSNASGVGLRYCFISNCTDSEPWGFGRLCEREQQVGP